MNDSKLPTTTNQLDPSRSEWTHTPMRWGWADALALLIWTLVVVSFFHDVVLLRKALFYFDVSEINYPYRDFFASELKAGRFSRWIPSLYCGHALYSESQAGYLHPFKYLLYPWLPTWQAFGLDTVLSIWLAGVGAFGWFRRHVGRVGAWAGSALFAFSGFTWAHFVHTSMINALASVPFAFWALELAWDGRRLRGVALGSIALACQVFAGHLQDVILTGSALGVYGVYRASIERGARQRLWSIGAVLLMGAGCVLLSAVQWIPSKELIDRSPRAGGLTWSQLTYGSWSPELLPTMLMREAYGTRARDTDWMDGFYPFLEMNTYVGLIGLGLAIVGLGATRDRWVVFWPILGALSVLLMLGRFTFLMDVFPYIPFVNTGRVPVRYHLWFALAVSALAAVGVDRLARVDCGRIGFRGVFATLTALVAISTLTMAYVYQTAWTERSRWPLKYHADRYDWLRSDLLWGCARTFGLAILAGMLAKFAAISTRARTRHSLAALLAGLLAIDLLWAHAHDVPVIDPSYWTSTPKTAEWLLQQPDLGRVFGESVYASGEPGYASERVDFMAVRELLAWSLPPVWGLSSTGGETPIIPRRRLKFTDHEDALARFDIEGLRYVLTSARRAREGDGGARVGGAVIYRNPGVLPRARIIGRPEYASSADEAGALMKELDKQIRERLVVEDPDRPIRSDAISEGTADIIRDDPERVDVAVDLQAGGYLFLADSFDPGWSALIDGGPAAIRPAYAAFRAVFVPEGRHLVSFRYEPAGFQIGLIASLGGAFVMLCWLFWPWRMPALSHTHGRQHWPAWWPLVLIGVVALVMLGSIVNFSAGGGIGIQSRWRTGIHRFTWGAGIEAMRPRGE